MFVNTPHGLGFSGDVKEQSPLVSRVEAATETIRSHPPRARRLAKPSQKDRLLAYLREHGSITKDEGRELLGIMNVGGRILDLREDGHQIRTEMIPVHNRFEEETEVAKYILAEDR